MWPFTRPKKSPLARDDVFWLREAARIEGIIKAASESIAAGSHVLLVTHLAERVERLADAAAVSGLPLDGLAQPATAAELIARLRSQPSPCALLTLAGMLRPSAPSLNAATGRAAGIAVIAAERHPLRARDDAVLAFAESLAASRAEFHVCNEDPFLRALLGEQTDRMLHAMGMKDNEAISHALLTRSVKRAQEKLAQRCPDHANIESWLAEELHRH